MEKKFKTLDESEDKQLAEAVRNSAQQIWQAGLGAFAKAQEEGGKVFAKLVKDGSELQKRTKKLAEGKASDVTQTVTRMADNVSKQAAGSWDKLEQVFEDRVSRSLDNLDVPTYQDIQALNKRIDELAKAVAALSRKEPKSSRVAFKSAPRKTATKTAAKRSSARKGPVKKAASIPD